MVNHAAQPKKPLLAPCTVLVVKALVDDPAGLSWKHDDGACHSCPRLLLASSFLWQGRRTVCDAGFIPPAT